MGSMEICQPLTEQEYATVFSTFIMCSTEYAEIKKLAKPLIDGFEGKAVDLMSIGAGTGFLENDFIQNLGLKVNNFLAIEPNDDHLQELKETASNWGKINLEIDSRYFDETYETTKKFDLILMSHSMYCMANPVAVIIKAKSLLKPSGQLVMFSQTEKGGHELFVRMRKSVEMDRPINDHYVTSKFISEALSNNAITHQIKEGPSHLDVTDFIQQNSSPTRNDIVTFFLQTDYLGIPKFLQQIIYDMVKERVTTLNDGRHMLLHPTGMIVVQNM